MKEIDNGENFKIRHMRQRFAKISNTPTKETSYIWKDNLYGKEHFLEVIQKDDMIGKQAATIKE